MNARTIFLTLRGLASFSFSMAWAAIMIWQVQEVGLTPLQLVLVGTCLEIGIFLFEIPTGIVADIYSRRLSVIIGYGVMSIGLLMQAGHSFALLALGQGLWGFGYTFTSGAEDAWITDEIGIEAASPAFLRASQVSSIAGIVGTFAAMFIGSWQLNAPIVLGAGTVGLLTLFLIWKMPEHGFKPAPREDRQTWGHMLHTFREGARFVRGSNVLLAILGIGLFIGLQSEGYDRLNTKHLLNSFTLPDFGGLQPIFWLNLLGIGMSLLNIGATQWMMKRVPQDNNRRMARLLTAIGLFWLIGQVIFALAGQFWLAVACTWAISVMRHLYEPLERIWVNTNITDSTVRATVLSMRGQVDALGEMLGGPPVGGLGERYGVRVALMASAALLTPVVALLGWQARDKTDDASQV